MRNDLELTKQIVEIVEGFHANPYIEQIEKLKYKNGVELYESGYNDAIDDVISILKGDKNV